VRDTVPVRLAVSCLRVISPIAPAAEVGSA
jgi:hypothetical protein